MDNEGRVWNWRAANLFRVFKTAGFEPRTIFDIGSSHCGWSYEVSQILPAAQFHLFEPLLDHQEFYRENTEIILRVRPDFRIHKVAIGEVDGMTKLGMDECGYSASTLVTETDATFTALVEVPIRRLDAIVFEQNLPRPDVMKLDVQGGEMGVLIGSGSLLDTVQLIQIEVWLLRRYGGETPLLHEITEYLGAKGFLPIGFGDFHYGDLHELYAADAFFARSSLLEEYASRLPKGSLTGEG